MEDQLANLATLTERQHEVLSLVCSGLDYKAIGGELFIAESTVKAHMGNIYQKLGLNVLPSSQRTKMLFGEYCQLLKDAPLDLEGLGEEIEPEPVPESIEKMVDEDEKAMVLWQPKDLQEIEPIHISPVPYKPKRMRWLLLGAILGVGLVGGILLIFRNLFGFEGNPIEQGSSTAVEQVAQPPVQVTVLVTTTPDLNQPSPTPVVEEVFIIVTPTSLPTPTALYNTPADSVLEIGEWWSQDGVWLRITDVEYSATGINIILGLWNRTGDTLIFVWSTPKNFSLTDNRSQFYEAYSFHTSDRREVIEADGLLEFLIRFEDTYFFDEAVTDLWLTLKDYSRISHAQWHLRVPK